MTAQSFPRTHRLMGAREFSRVFAAPRRVGGSAFLLLFRPNGLARPRLGLAISKKCARRAVDRTRLKRIVRESFRLHQCALSGWDIVVLGARDAPALPNQRLFAALERSWAAIEKQSCADFSSP